MWQLTSITPSICGDILPHFDVHNVFLPQTLMDFHQFIDFLLIMLNVTSLSSRAQCAPHPPVCPRIDQEKQCVRLLQQVVVFHYIGSDYTLKFVLAQSDFSKWTINPF